MQLTFENNNNCAIIKLNSEVNEDVIQTVRQKIDNFIESTDFHNLIFDFSKTFSIDDTVIGLILGRYRKLKNLGRTLNIRNARGDVDFMLSVSGIYTIIKKIN